MKNSFENLAANSSNPKWNNIISRQSPLYHRSMDTRNDFERDYTRIIHSNSYRRLKHKTQVFFSPDNDHICTRIEHVTHVDSISYTVANYLGLNTALTKAIAVSHDLGHSPFGHEGERILSSLSQKYLGKPFWHERNGLDFVDNVELLEDSERFKQNLNLTYAVRDGIVSHCGEIDENGLKPREDFIDLKDYSSPNQYAPYTWEACIVKVADKISYIGRDIEDAITFKILDDNLLLELSNLLKDSKVSNLNNTNIINYFATDLCENSSPERGICFSNDAFNLMNKIKAFNYKNIYLCAKLQSASRYFKLVITEIYETLLSCYVKNDFLASCEKLKKYSLDLSNDFYEFLKLYYHCANRNDLKLKNKVLFEDESISNFHQAILYYISGMTDHFAIKTYNKIIGF